MQYFEEARNIWASFVPKAGQADTVQGELLRAVEKLRDEATRNGNANWDEGFETLLSYLNQKLSDKRVFPPDLAARNTQLLAQLANADAPCMRDDVYDELGDRVVEYFRFYGSQTREFNPNLHR